MSSRRQLRLKVLVIYLNFIKTLLKLNNKLIPMQIRGTCFIFSNVTFLFVSVPGINVNDGMVKLMMFRYSGFSSISMESFITLMLRLEKMSGE